MSFCKMDSKPQSVTCFKYAVPYRIPLQKRRVWIEQGRIGRERDQNPAGKITNSTHLTWIQSSLMASVGLQPLPPEVHMTSFLDATLSPFSWPWKTFIFLTFPVSWDCYCDLQISISVSCFIQNVQGNSLLHLAWPQQLSSTLMFPKLLPTFMSVTTPSSTASSRYTMDHWTAGPQVM